MGPVQFERYCFSNWESQIVTETAGAELAFWLTRICASVNPAWRLAVVTDALHREISCYQDKRSEKLTLAVDRIPGER